MSAGGPKPATVDSRVRESHPNWWLLNVIPAFQAEGYEFEARLEQYSKRLLKKEEKEEEGGAMGPLLEGPVENLSRRAQKRGC